MPLTVSQSATAVCPRVPASFLGKGGAEPYLYEVLPGGAGGTINPATGEYLAPNRFNLNPKLRYDTIQVTDYDDATATARILVGSPLMLVMEIVQKEMGLAAERVYMWDQKLMQPTDSGMYVAISVVSANPIGSSNRFNSDANQTDQFVTMQGSVDFDLISRDTSARDRKEELILALDSNYSRRQQDANSFFVGKLSTRFTNLSQIDGDAIPYRYKATVKIQYLYIKARPAEYFDSFEVGGDIDPENTFEFSQE